MKKIILLLSLVVLISVGAVAQCCKPKEAESTSKKEDLPGQTVKLKITGMTCAGCSNHIHEALTKREGVLDNLVEYPGDSALVTYDPEKITVKEIIEAIVAAGYKAEKLEDKQKEKLNHR